MLALTTRLSPSFVTIRFLVTLSLLVIGVLLICRYSQLLTLNRWGREILYQGRIFLILMPVIVV
jgi:hypothetical protein